MKQYHTDIIIHQSRAKVWEFLTDFAQYPDWNPLVGRLEGKMQVGEKIATFIVPLNKTFYPVLLQYEPEQELVWQGVQGAKFLLAGKHYYRLESLGEEETKLYHGEYFTGLFSHFIAKKLLNKMYQTFLKHNEILKKRLENG